MAENLRQRRKSNLIDESEVPAITSTEKKCAITLIGTIVLVVIVVLGMFFMISPADNQHHRFIELDRECNPWTERCIVVADLINASQVKRAMLFADKSVTDPEVLKKGVGTMVPLICPTPKGIADFHSVEMAEKSATGQCKLDHGKFGMAYVAAMAMMPFVVGALRNEQPQEGDQPKALVIGLGGGAVDMFLHQKFPWLDITVFELDPLVAKLAHKWFGVANDTTRRTIVADGLEALRRAVKKDEKFDLVSVDACEMFGALKCPPNSFMTNEVLQKIKAVVKPTGVFVINILPDNEEQEMEFVTEHQEKFLTVFPTCIRTRFVAELANVLVCLPTRISSAEELANIRAEWDQKRREFTEAFGLGELLADYKLS